MAVYTQTERALQIETKLGADALLIARIEGEETISRLFRFELELASPRIDLDTGALLRTPAAVSFPLHNGSWRTIHGLFSRFAQTGKHEDLATYRAELVAWPWFLSLRRNRRVFQEKSILDIAEEIFRSWGFADFDFRCAARPAREYVVQYDETDWDFLSRWFETEGIFYFFQHSPEGHVLVLADGNSVFQPCPEIAEAWLRGQTVIDMDVITALTREHAVQTGQVTVRDYDYLQPSFSLESSLEGDGPGEIYDYPGDFSTPEDGDRYARYRIEAEEARKVQVGGDGNCRWMMCGHSFQVQGHFNPETNGEYILTSVRHSCRAGGFRSADVDELDYQNTFECIPADVPYRPLRLTPRPVVRGSQTAVVMVGAEATDQHGRVKVKFHWEREGERDGDSSCWIRVTSPWAGQGWGYMQLPHVGHEVVVSFLEGDPDRPIITGRVYNAENTPPLSAAQSSTQSIIRDHAGNEIVTEGKPGGERIRLFSPYNDSKIVLGAPNETPNQASCDIETEGSLFMKAVGGAVEEYMGDHRITIHGDKTEGVANDYGLFIEGNCLIKVGGSYKLEHDKPFFRHNKLGAPYAELNESIKRSTTLGVESNDFLGAKVEYFAGLKKSESRDLNLEKAKLKKIDADVGITLTVGDAQIIIEKDAIVIGAKNIILNGTDSVKIMSEKGSMEVRSKDNLKMVSEDTLLKGKSMLTLVGEKVREH